MRKDVTLSRKGTRCPNTSMLAGGRYIAKPGFWLTYSEQGETRCARVVGQVTAPDFGAPGSPKKTWILAIALGSDMSFGMERWIDPLDVSRIAENPPHAMLAWITGKDVPRDPQTIRELIAYGTVSDEYIHLIPVRVREIKERKK